MVHAGCVFVAGIHPSGHEYKDLLGPCDGMHMSIDYALVYNLILSTTTECDYLNGWIRKRSHSQKSHPKMVNPRGIPGERRRRREEE